MKHEEPWHITCMLLDSSSAQQLKTLFRETKSFFEPETTYCWIQLYDVPQKVLLYGLSSCQEVVLMNIPVATKQSVTATTMRHRLWTQHRVSFSARPICGCHNCKVSPTSRDSHKATCFISVSWRKHPRVMTTSVSLSYSRKTNKARLANVTKNPHKSSTRTCWPTIWAVVESREYTEVSDTDFRHL